ncbi:hypothetical protein V1525DRAFT_435818 [Lipomyces kononenkoae]|uniref:Uncharacterized protein n=1 Tax=Lipomyces kononenkoae TaxID=34357 RepID=A0ACC3SRM4_LIPKO
MVAAQHTKEEYAHRGRDPAVSYQLGDEVYLDLRNIRMDRPSKKLGARYEKYAVQEKVRSHAYRLNTPLRIHPVFQYLSLVPRTTTT